ncbi:MAG: hypothetical protein NWE89_07650 [Candidatus Bathyarchaeota archaeon]|nr:hypothetical protein [Candidatus Bathyarchaeota archaeon]
MERFPSRVKGLYEKLDDNSKIALGAVIVFSMMMSIYVYSSQVTNTRYPVNEYFKEGPQTISGEPENPFDWIKALIYLGIFGTLVLILYTYLMSYPWFVTMITNLRLSLASAIEKLLSRLDGLFES